MRSTRVVLVLLGFLASCGPKPENRDESGSETTSEIASPFDPLNITVAIAGMAAVTIDAIGDNSSRMTEAVSQALMQFQRDKSVSAPTKDPMLQNLARNTIVIYKKKSVGNPPPPPSGGDGSRKQCQWGIAFSAGFQRPNKAFILPQEPAKVVAYAFYYSKDRALERARAICKEQIDKGVASKEYKIEQNAIGTIRSSCDKNSLVIPSTYSFCDQERAFLSPTILRKR